MLAAMSASAPRPAPRARVARAASAPALAALVTLLVGSACTPAPPREGRPAPPPASAAPAVSRGATPPPPEPPLPAASSSSVAASDPAPAPPPPFRSSETFRLLIRGGEVIDGSGAPRRRADVVVRGDRVVFVGEVDPSVEAERVIDARGAVVTPGFIDAHAHADPRSDVEPALAMGVTTLVVGQDGFSPAARIGAYLAALDAARPRVNVATLVGHATARAEARVGGGKRGRAAALGRLRAAVEQGIGEGAFGLSTGLEYDSGRGADMEELAAAAEPVGARGGVVMSHLRSEDDDRIEASLDELFEQCRRSGARAHVAHLKIVYGKGAARAEEVLLRLAAARAAGLEVTADLYPYTASYTTVGILFPDFARPPHSYRAAKQRRRADLAAYLRARVTRRNGPEATLFGTGELAGKTLAQAARERGVPFEDLLIELGPNGAEAAYFVMDEAVMERLFLDPFVMIGTDGGGGSPHPRGHGSFARVLEALVRERGLLSLEEAVRKMAALPARTLRLEGERGCVRAGCAADLLVFAPSEVRTRADYRAPRRLAEGMRFVIVNGAIAREAGRPTAARTGRALRFSSATHAAHAAAPAHAAPASDAESPQPRP